MRASNGPGVSSESRKICVVSRLCRHTAERSRTTAEPRSLVQSASHIRVRLFVFAKSTELSAVCQVLVCTVRFTQPLWTLQAPQTGRRTRASVGAVACAAKQLCVLRLRRGLLTHQACCPCVDFESAEPEVTSEGDNVTRLTACTTYRFIQQRRSAAQRRRQGSRACAAGILGRER